LHLQLRFAAALASGARALAYCASGLVALLPLLLLLLLVDSDELVAAAAVARLSLDAACRHTHMHIAHRTWLKLSLRL
jgi:hypothetical protein